MTLTRLTLAIASSVLLLATLAACGADDEATDAAPQSGGMPGGAGLPGAAGEVAAVSGRTAQVQSPQGGQVAVTWTRDTTFTEQVGGTLDDVAVGACVLVTTDDASADATAPTAVTAAGVRLTDANADGSCGPGADGPGGGQRPEGTPSDLRSDAPDGGRMRGFGTLGEVTGVSAAGFTLSATNPGSDENAEVTVTVDDATTYTTTVAATASAVVVGRCVTARGDSDDTGAVRADTIGVSDPVDGECAGGLGFAMRGPGDGAA